MKAVLIKKPGGADELYIGQCPTPRPGAEEILVKVKATSVNRMDIYQREGNYPVPEGASDILGVDLAGDVVELGEQASRFRIGDRVMGLMGGGGYAEYAVIHERLARSIPENLTYEQASAIPEVFMTAYQTLFWIGKVRPGQHVLIHAGAGGVGSAAIQLATKAQARAIVTAGSEEKIGFCRSLGAVAGHNYREGPFYETVLFATRNAGVDVILDFIGAPYWEQNLRVLKKGGRLVVVSFMGGHKGPELDFAKILTRWIHIVGTTLRARDLAYRIALTDALYGFAMERFRDGRIGPVIDRVFPWQQVRRAHRYMEANKNKGKIVLNEM